MWKTIKQRLLSCNVNIKTHYESTYNIPGGPLSEHNVCQTVVIHNMETFPQIFGKYFHMNNYIVRSYRDVIVITKIAKRRPSNAQSTVMY